MKIILVNIKYLFWMPDEKPVNPRTHYHLTADYVFQKFILIKFN